ncbi:hypothetical protein ACQEWB_29800 [Streptomyces sp. CA-249302]|uniref:hypothetical protein n=1 Tax=Streptomyces sp. CA-249302 TaxID=3240058 RepID=UPI003D8E64F4
MRTAFGLLVVIVGMVWLVGGGSAVRSGGRLTLSALPYVLAAVGLLLILRAAVPRGLLVGPVALVAGGGLWAAYNAGVFEGETADRIWPSVVIAVGVALSLGVRTESGSREEEHPLRRYRSVLVPVDRRVLASSVPLQTLTVGSYFGNAVVDLSGAQFAEDSADAALRVVRVDVTVFFGRVELVVGPSCAVVKGNVESTHAVRFAERVVVYADVDQYLDLDSGAQRRPHRMVLNVLGLGGAVAVRSL